MSLVPNLLAKTTAIAPLHRETTQHAGVQLRGSVRRTPDFDACARSARASVCSDVTAASYSILAAGTVVRGTVAVRRQRYSARAISPTASSAMNFTPRADATWKRCGAGRK